MKTALALAWLVTVSASAQTLVNYKLASFTYTSPGVYTATTNIVVATNTTAMIRTFLATVNLTGANAAIQYAGLPALPVDFATQEYHNFPVLGPCTIALSVTASSSVNACAALLIQFDQVNTAVVPGEMLVQPAGFAASIALQTSTNLVAWQTLTNASFGKTNASRFFKMSLSIP